MADIVLKNVQGVNVIHKDVNKIRVATADGGTVEFSHSSGGCGGTYMSAKGYNIVAGTATFDVTQVSMTASGTLSETTQ